MKNLVLRLLGIALMLVTATQAVAGIYLVYGQESGNPVAVLDDQTDQIVFEEGYLSPRAHAWIGYTYGTIAPIGTTRLPLAFIPPATGYAVGMNVTLPSAILIPPTATTSPQLSHTMQSGHAWSAYQSNNAATGLGLVYSPSYGAKLSPSQKSARGNRSRAQAFRLDYYK